LRTPVSKQNERITDEGHKLAEQEIYPLIFNVSSEQIRFERTHIKDGKKGELLDGRFATDYIAYITLPELRSPLQIAIQERWRDPECYFHRDITITEWNNFSDTPSELYKLGNANIFVYGVVDLRPPHPHFLRVHAFDIPQFIRKFITGELKPKKHEENPRSNQSFLPFAIEDLEKYHCLFFNYDHGIIKHFEEIDIIRVTVQDIPDYQKRFEQNLARYGRHEAN
jgi:hypothetical protein